MKVLFVVGFITVSLACASAAPRSSKDYKDSDKATTGTIYNGGSSSSQKGGKHNGKGNKGGINGLDNTGYFNGNYNEGGVNGNGNGGSNNGNYNTGGFNGNGNGGSGEVDWQRFLDNLDLGDLDISDSWEDKDHGYEEGYGPSNWRKYLDTTPYPTRKPTPAGRKTTPYKGKKTTDAEATTYSPKQTTGKYDWSGQYDKWNNQDWGFDQDYWNNFNKQFQPGGKYHWSSYLPKKNQGSYGNYGNRWW